MMLRSQNTHNLVLSRGPLCVCGFATMGDSLRLAVGIIGNASTTLLYAAPILTFTRIVKKKNVEEFSCIPYIIALLNCCIYSWYGLPVVSHRWENFVIVPINGIGVLLELSFIIIFLIYASSGQKKRAAAMAAIVILVFITTALVSSFVFHDHSHRKMLVGTVGLVASAAMYGSPLSVVKQVIKTKSVEFMPFYLSFFSFLASTLWMTYGLLSHDLFLASPNIVGCPLGLFQLMLYCKYRKKGIIEEPPESKWDVESNGEKIKQQLAPADDFAIDEKEDKPKQQLQLVVSSSTDENHNDQKN